MAQLLNYYLLSATWLITTLLSLIYYMTRRFAPDRCSNIRTPKYGQVWTASRVSSPGFCRPQNVLTNGTLKHHMWRPSQLCTYHTFKTAILGACWCTQVGCFSGDIRQHHHRPYTLETRRPRSRWLFTLNLLRMPPWSTRGMTHIRQAVTFCTQVHLLYVCNVFVFSCDWHRFHEQL